MRPRCNLALVDEVGYTPSDRKECRLFCLFAAISDEEASAVITSYKAFDEQAGGVHYPVIVTEVLDPLLHHIVGFNSKANLRRLQARVCGRDTGVERIAGGTSLLCPSRCVFIPALTQAESTVRYPS